MRKNLLITGPPGVGKTTLIRKVTEQLVSIHPIGFFTTEIRQQGSRLGFELVSFDGQKGILSHINERSCYKVGKYGVNLKGFEDFLLNLPIFDPNNRIIIIDEIGKMECYSTIFKTIIDRILNSSTPLLATIARKGDGYIEKIKRRGDVKIYFISKENRDLIIHSMISDIRDLIVD